MSKIQIIGSTEFYDDAMDDETHPFNALVKKLQRYDVKFSGTKFTYTVEHKQLFLSEVNAATAIALNSLDGVESFEGYPIWISATDASAAVPDYFPDSTYYDESDDEGAFPIQKTFSEWVIDQNHDLYTIDGVTFAGDFWRHGLDFASQVYADAGYGLLEDSDARSKIASQGVS